MTIERSQTLLLKLIAAASAGPDFASAGAINRQLRLMRNKPDGDAAEAIAAFVESPVAALLYDEQGTSCHQEAVDTLISFGEPYAQLLPARELERARRRLSKPELQALKRSRRQAATLVGAGALAAVALSGWYLWDSGFSGLVLSAIAAAGVSALGVATLLRALPIASAHRGPATLLVLAGGLAFAGSLRATLDPLGIGLLSALAAAGLALVVLSSWRDPLET